MTRRSHEGILWLYQRKWFHFDSTICWNLRHIFYFWSTRMSHFRPYLMQSSLLRHPPIIQSITTYGGLGWDDPKWQWMTTLAVTFTPTGNLESLGDLLWINNRLRPSAVKRLWSLVGHQLKTHVPELSGVVQRKLFSTSQQWVTNSP